MIKKIHRKQIMQEDKKHSSSNDLHLTQSEASLMQLLRNKGSTKIHL